MHENDATDVSMCTRGFRWNMLTNKNFFLKDLVTLNLLLSIASCSPFIVTDLSAGEKCSVG